MKLKDVIRPLLPATTGELARATGKSQPNVTRTLKTMDDAYIKDYIVGHGHMPTAVWALGRKENAKRPQKDLYGILGRDKYPQKSGQRIRLAGQAVDLHAGIQLVNETGNRQRSA